MKPMTKEEREKIVEKHLSALMEVMDSVQILGSWQEEERGTSKIIMGRGDWYARVGLAHQFIKDDQNEDMALFLAQELKEPPDAAEEWKEP